MSPVGAGSDGAMTRDTSVDPGPIHRAAASRGFGVRAAATMLACLIASLPFWPLRIVGGLGASHLLLAAAVPLALVRIMATRRIAYRFGAVDIFLTLYLALAAASLIVSPVGLGLPALAKSLSYWVTFVAMGVLLHGVPLGVVKRACVVGVASGVLLFLGAAVLMIVSGQADLGSLSPNSIYWDLAFPVYRGLLTSAGGLEDVRSADVMRSAVGEVFALYGLLVLISFRRATAFSIALLVLSATIAWAIASRRAGLALLIGFLLLSVRWRRRTVGVQILALLGLVSTAAAIVPSYLGRFGDLSSTQRLDRLRVAMDRIASSPFSGHGYASQIDGQYVHNIVVGSWYMLGILGLALAMWLVAYLLTRAVQAADRRTPEAGVLLLIPFLGVLVGSTVEGTFTVVGWVSILVWSIRERRGGVEPGEPEAADVGTASDLEAARFP
jgi:O-antigen ligase